MEGHNHHNHNQKYNSFASKQSAVLFDPTRNVLVTSDSFNQFSSLPLSIAINNSIRRMKIGRRHSQKNLDESGESVVRKIPSLDRNELRRSSFDNSVENPNVVVLKKVGNEGNGNPAARSMSLCIRRSTVRRDLPRIPLRLKYGDLVWFLIPGGDSSEPSLFYPGVVIEYHSKGNVVTIKPDPSGVDPSEVKEGQQYVVENNGMYVRKRLLVTNTPVGVMDLITMNDLSEPALLWNIRQRYKNGNIYTYVGSMLISVNPYKMYDNIYGLPVVKKYEGRVLGDLPPHLFALASGAYTRMCKDREPQVVIISGESGSGKTECTKLILGYLALVNKSPSNLITEQILEASPLLESFGNAKTTKNDNSSRFGKYLQVFFDEASSTSIITGCRITEYLLEKSRIVTQNTCERNYHVFYELLEGLTKEQKEKYGLLSADKYFYLNQGSTPNTEMPLSIPGKNDSDDFQALVSAMQILGFSSPEIDCVFRVLASVLHLGNVYFHRKAMKQGMEGVEIGSDAEIQWIAHLLEVSPEGLRKVLTSRTTETPRGEKMTTPLTIDQSLDCRDAIAKILYSNLFTWLVQRVNRIVHSSSGGSSSLSLEKRKQQRTCINILDIFGFENFKENSFEQLCINYANESIHHFLTRHVFKLEQAEYAKEKIDWVPIEYEDNMPIISLLIKKPVGILHLLDDESNFPKGTDGSFLEKCHYNHALNENYLRQRMSSKEFGIKHYAGNVWYNTEGFLEKNRGDFASSSQQDFALRKLLCSSKEKILAKMFILGTQADHQHPSNGQQVSPGQYQGRNRGPPRSRHHQQQNPNTRLFVTMKPRAPTVSARFTSSLNSLLESMSTCSPWFIRCVKPNNDKKPNVFDTSLVLDQLRYSGILETIKIRKLGYPIRYGFANFVYRYKCLIPTNTANQQSTRDITRLILTSHQSTGDDFQIGASKVFLREVLEQRLEKARYDLLNKAAKVIQAAVRGHVQHKKFTNQKRAAQKIQAFYRMHRARRDFLKIRTGVTRLQATVKMRRDQRRYRAVREEIVKRNQKRKILESAEKQAKAQGLNYGLTGVNHLEIPAELAFILSRLGPVADAKSPDHRSLIRKITQSSDMASDKWGSLLDMYAYKHGGTSYKLPFQKGGHEQLKMRREPIVSPFLKTSPKDEALIIFKLILRYMNDVSLGSPTGRERELILQNYIVHKGIKNELIRDEILIQILNQTRGNPNKINCERGWLLLAACLSSFQPRDENLFAYLLTQFSELRETDEAVEKIYKAMCQLKCLQMAEEGKRGRVRVLPPFGPAELRTIDRKQHGQIFLEIEGVYERVESWVQVSEVAGRVGAKRFGRKNHHQEGLPFWTLDFVGREGGEDAQDRYELDSSAFIFDSNFESVDYSPFGKVFGSEASPPPALATLLFVKMMYCQPPQQSHQPILRSAVMQKTRPMENLNRISPLSSKSRLNERYFKAESAMPVGGSNSSSRTKSLDNLLDDPVELSKAALQKKRMLGLSDSKLNQRYNSSIENLSRHSPRRKTSDTYFEEFVDEEEELEEQVDFNSEDDEEYEPELVAATTNKNGPMLGKGMASGNINGNGNRSGPPRYIKAISGSSKKAPSSVGSKSFGYYGKSSAMSDTSEAPSLASHVRRVRVPSQASDVDQFLDDLFSPVLEGNNALDDLSDVRSLVSNLKGGGTGGVFDDHPGSSNYRRPNKPTSPSDFIQSAMEQNIQIQQQLMEQNQALQELLRRSGTEKGGSSSSNSSDVGQPHNFGGKMNGMGKVNGNIPVPPPLPPTLLGEINGHRPFMDPYGRAKTVRIGKWRWPPKEGEGTGDDDFMEFRARLEEKRKLDKDEDMHNEDNDWLDKQPPKLRHGMGPPKKYSAPNMNSNSSMQITPTPIRNPFGDVTVGKLKLSHEMRAKLEQVTSVRMASGSGQKKSAPGLFETQVDSHMSQPKKLDESRRNVLQEKLMGGTSNGVSRVHHQALLHPPPPPPLPITHGKNGERHGEMGLGMDENYDTLSQVYNQVTSPKKGVSTKVISSKGFDREERIIEPPDYSDENSDYETSTMRKKLTLHPNRFQNSYAYMVKRFRLRKDLVSEDELKDPELIGFLREQILRDIKYKNPRIMEAERRSCANIGEGGAANLVEIARSWSLYFWRFFKVHQQTINRGDDAVRYVAVNEKGLKLVGLRQNKLHVLEFYSWSKVVSILAAKSSSTTTDVVTITLGNGQKLALQCDAAVNVQRTCDTFFMNDVKSSKQSGPQDHRNGPRTSLPGPGPDMHHGHINMMKSAASSRPMGIGMMHHQIQSSGGGSFGDDMDSTVGLEFGDDGDDISNTPTGGHSHSQFSRKVTAASFYDHHHLGDEEDNIMEFHASQNYGMNKSGQHAYNGDGSHPSPPMDHAHDTIPRSRSISEDEGRMTGQFENDGKHSLLQFALKYFRQKDKFQHSGSEKEDQGCWTWREQVSCVKYSPKMVQQSLIPLPSEQLNKLALECFASILKYMGDFPEHPHKDKKHKQESPPPAPLLTEVEAVYTLLRNCHISSTNPHLMTPPGSSPDSGQHQHPGMMRPPLLLGLADEVYCQIMKQTTNNTNPKSAQRGWRLFTILAAYFTCSDTLRPYLFKYLETNAYDKRRAFHGTALVTLQNLRKTFKYGGRRNVPSVEEITAITAGRNAKRQIFRLPGGAQRVINVKATTVVQDVLEELCATCLQMEGSAQEERGEWSVYCIVEGDTTMPLQREEYILDVTTELQKNAQVYYLIFCRSVWYFPLRLEATNNDTYVDLIFNQIAPDYLEGLLLIMPGQTLDQSIVYDIARIAALLHRAADLRTPPTLKETKYLLPKPALAARDMRPNQWVSLVNKYWAEERMGEELMRPIQAKAIVLEILQKWDLFGSSFFAVKRLADPSPPEEYILALNKNGVHFLDIITHETLNWWSYSEIISTRKVKNEDGLLYLDLKVGNLMQQRITRLQTEHAHEISRLIRQYIHIQKYSNPNANPHNNTATLPQMSPK